MTRAEYLEFVQESLAFPPRPALEHAATVLKEPGYVLRDTDRVCSLLRVAHADYCAKVAEILEIDISYREEGGPGDKPDLPNIFSVPLSP